MGIAKQAVSVCPSSKKATTTTTGTAITTTTTSTNPHHKPENNNHSQNSMSHEYPHPHSQPHNPHQQQANNVFAFSNGFDRSGQVPAAPTAAHDHGGGGGVGGLHPVYESAGMLSEMFNFGHGPSPSPDLLDYRRTVGGMGPTEWYTNNRSQDDHHQMDAAAMQLFMTNPQRRSPSPPQPAPNIEAADSGGGSGFHSLAPAAVAARVIHPSAATTTTNNNDNTNNNANFWGTSHHHHMNNPAELSGIVEGQGLSLSLSSSLQHLGAAKQAEDEFGNIGPRSVGDNQHPHIMFFNQQHHHQEGVGPSSSTTTSSAGGHFFKNLAPGGPLNLQPVTGFGGPSSSSQHQVHLGFGSAPASTSSLGVVNVLRNSKYAKPAQELLEEFCSVGRGQVNKAKKLARQNSSTQHPSTSGGGGSGGRAGGSSTSVVKDPPQLSPADRIEHQRRKVKLLAMLDEVEKRYNHYCEQMQMVVNSLDIIMGYGAAVTYTSLAQKAMSRHFRCLKDAIEVKLKQSCEMLGEKDPSTSSGITKGETPRLKVLEQSLRQQRAFHQMGMMDQEAWRPQRGLPERSVTVLRAWLFEHFLHPYPSDADKHLLARQTGLSRNQVSNWFINARVRLWKPMIEEMYQQEAKEVEEEREKEREENQTSSSTSNSFATQQQQQQQAASSQNPMPPSSLSSSTAVTAASTSAFSEGKRSNDTLTPPIMGALRPDSDPSSIHRHHHLQSPPPQPPHTVVPGGIHSRGSQDYLHHPPDDTCHFGDDNDNVGVGPTTMIHFGNTTGDVSLTLGLRHAGNTPDKGPAFSVRDFDSC